MQVSAYAIMITNGNNVSITWKPVVPSILVFYNNIKIQQNSTSRGRTQNLFTLFSVHFGCVLSSKSDFASLSPSFVHLPLSLQLSGFSLPYLFSVKPPFRMLSEVSFLKKIF